MTPPTPITLTLAARPAKADTPALCAQLSACLTSTGATDVICDVGRVTQPDLAVVDALARLKLTSRRAGARMRIRDPAPRLLQLLGLVGLLDLVDVEVVGEPEEREPALGVQEGIEADDLPP
ncbi:STAS domain-containing protein [Streptomyces sp. NBC_01304]|uniref:STAS domain-containing protein n=1 Tax=Streptomyces sp. NBC_01304 TaxID=2903818 RepID=UPI002E0E1F59|nr:STAS domain-containing protein [Streptomyces sp. NBC_01304]